MKLLHRSVLALACLVLVALEVGAAPTTVPSVRIRGTTYIPLGTWAEVNHLSAAWIKRGDTLQVTNQNARVRLSVSTREAQVDDIAIWLVFPLVNQKGVVFVSKIDADSTLHPMLFPPRHPPGARIKTICIDPGHGGKDPGNHVGAQQEKDYTLFLAFELREQLRHAGFNVVLTRGSDNYVGLPNRPAAAKATRSDLFVSLHFNATSVDRGTVRGIETYALTPAGARSTAAAGQGDTGGWTTGNRNDDDNVLLACEIHEALIRRLHTDDRGVRRARFWVLRDAVMPAVLVEGGFMSHPTEGRKIFNAAYRHEMAAAIREGIVAYKQIVERAH